MVKEPRSEDSADKGKQPRLYEKAPAKVDSFNVGRRIQELCEKNNITKYRLAKWTGIDQTALAHNINGKTIPTVANLERICDAFGITLAQFFSVEELPGELTKDQKELCDIWQKCDRHHRELLMTTSRCIFAASEKNE
ncbi:MAG: helix-turn-helix transcriptional regulator [Lachnospiraceae bacterium]|nr:helix-turn-helix transcriptional regulator [Lachnospiraceae bacterium]